MLEVRLTIRIQFRLHRYKYSWPILVVRQLY